MLTQDRLKELLEYCPETGVFRWRVSRGGVNIGDVAGSPHEDGQLTCCIDKKHYLMHRLAWLYVSGEFPVGLLDHRDRCPGNNRIGNLRPADKSLNAFNTLAHKDNSSGVKGVSWSKTESKWRGEIMVKGVTHRIGYYTELDDAAAAIRRLREALHGEFACHG